MTKLVGMVNFNGGPGCLPESVVSQIRDEFSVVDQNRVTIVEQSHRGKEFKVILDSATALLRELLMVPDDYKIVFLHGGASMQFVMLAMNALKPGQTAGYNLTGVWGLKAYEAAREVYRGDFRYGVGVVGDGKSDNYTKISEINLKPSGELAPSSFSYIHVTSNETANGTQYRTLPDYTNFVSDVSSDVLSQPIDWSKHAMVYGGTQKNMGVAGLGFAIIRKSFLDSMADDVPAMLSYKEQVKGESLYNTPSMFPLYVTNLVLKWVKEQGGLFAMQANAKSRAELIYGVIDQYPEFYKGTAHKEHRSLMNVTFKLKNDELEKKFLKAAEARGFLGLVGHRATGGVRASIYNAMPMDGIVRLANYMISFVEP